METTLPLLTENDSNDGTGNSHGGAEPGFGGLTTPRGPLPLKAMDVQVRIDALVATTEVRQTFVNNLNEPLEATYIFPLPDQAAVTSFRLEVAGRVIDGLLKERDEARREYSEAIQSGRRAAITEEERPNVFTLRVGNVLAGESAVVHLSLTGPIPCRDGEAELRFPLVVAPRYIPGTPLDGESIGDGVACDTDAVPDASRITPPVLLQGYPNPVHLSLEVDLNPCGLSIGEVRSSLHSVVTQEGEDGARRIRLQPRERLDRDFVLRFRPGADAIRTSLVVEADKDGGGKLGTFLLTLVPPTTIRAASRPRDTVFILDRSGSMEGWKLTAARRAVERMIETLRDEDRFNVFAFGNTVVVPEGFDETRLWPGSRHLRARAASFLAQLTTHGGTEMAEPLVLAMKALNSAPPAGVREKVIVLVTDGQVGNEDQLLREVASGIESTRIFALGIDRAVNEGFLKRLASSTGGNWEIVESESRLDEAMDRTHRLIASPVLTDLRIHPDGFDIEADSLVPARLPGLFQGVPILVQGRWKGNARGSLSLTARTAEGGDWSGTVPGSMGSSGAAASVWARGRIRDLEDRHAAAVGDVARDGIAKQIVETSLRFHVLSRFTAYVAVDRSEVANPGGSVQKILQPVEMPQGWERGELRDVLLCEPSFESSYLMSAGFRRQASTPWRKSVKDLAAFSPSTVSRSDLVEEMLSNWQKLRRIGLSQRQSLRKLFSLLESFVKTLEEGACPEDRIQPFRELLVRVRPLLVKRGVSRGDVSDLWAAWKDLLVAFARDEDAATRPGKGVKR